MADDAFSIKQVRGDYAKVTKAFRDAGTKEMRTRIRKIMAEETKPIRKAIKQAAIDTLPKRGGLNKFAGVMPSQNTDFREKSAGVKIVLKKKGHDMVNMDKGRLRHPLFGNRKYWHTQTVRSGFFTETIDKGKDDLERRVRDALEKYMDEIERKAS